jgi:glycosyltransferase 2 family protein
MSVITQPATRNALKHWLIGLLLLSGLIIAALNRSEIEQFAEIARKAQPFWLCAAAVLQLGTYFSVAGSWHSVLSRTEFRLSLPSMVPLALAKLFSDQAMPSGGMSGGALLVAALKRRGVDKPICMAILLVSFVSSYAADLIVAAVSVALLWYFHELQPWILLVACAFALIAVTIPTLALWVQRKGNRGLPPWLGRVPKLRKFLGTFSEAPVDLIRSPAVLWTATVFQLLVILLDAATLWIMLLAVGQHVSIWVALPGFFLASMVAMIGPIPLGLGTFEATCVTVLHLLGVPVAPALTGTLLFRGFTMWLPMLPGMWLARRELSIARSSEQRIADAGKLKQPALEQWEKEGGGGPSRSQEGVLK